MPDNPLTRNRQQAPPASIILIVLRRLRTPLIALVVIYAVSIAGLTIVPGIDANGKPGPPMSFFHAFYFVSYTATTIGYGEVPGAFSDAQRSWVTVSIYLTVVGWSYAILTLVALFQDRAFQHALRSARFGRRVRRLGEPFYVICGCGETGQLVTRALDRRGIRFVVVELNEERIRELELEDFRTDMPALAGDARRPHNLILAGFRHPQCRGMLALTGDDAANLGVAATTRLLNPQLPVLARVRTPQTAQNLRSFGTHHVIDPFAKFAQYLVLAMREPGCYRLLDWLTGMPGSRLRSEYAPPRGEWVICGYGKFGRAIVHELSQERVHVTIVDPVAKDVGPHVLAGLGTERPVLQAANIETAEGLVAATDDDFTNLAIAVTARELNPRLFIVLRQNLVENRVLFESYQADLVMISSAIIAQECLAALTTPLLGEFLAVVKRQTDAWADELIAKMQARIGDEAPTTWGVRVTPRDAPAVHQALARGGDSIRLGDLLRDPSDRDQTLAALPLMHRHAGQLIVLPAEDVPLSLDDEILFAGAAGASDLQTLALRNANALAYVGSGRAIPGGWVWRKIAHAFQHEAI